MPALMAAAYPALRPSWTTRIGRSVAASAIATDASAEALSATTTAESCTMLCEVSERRQPSSTWELLKVTITTAMRAAPSSGPIVPTGSATEPLDRAGRDLPRAPGK